VIDDWIDPEQWPEAVRLAAGQFEQGDLVEQPGFFYLGSAQHGIWRLTREAGDPEQSAELFELDPDQAPTFGMITTETCDIVEEDGRPRNPWVSVAPVYKLEGVDANNLDLLKNKRVAYMRQLTSSSFKDATWVVDVRIEFPVEKSWLVGKSPVCAFRESEEKAELASFLANRRDRPVLAGDLHKALLTPMRRWIERRKPTQREVILADVAEVRMAISGSALSPDGASLILIGDKGPIAREVRQAWDERWQDWHSKLEAAGISLLANEYTTLDELSARKYISSFRIPLEFMLA
jgi:hypothetical protein